MRSKDIALAAVFAALALAIPLLFRGSLQIVIPGVGYSATLASHVPVMLSIVLGPTVAAFVATASTVGFFMTLGPVVAARAATHIVWGIISAFAVKRGLSILWVLFLIALPIHAVGEGLVVMAFGIPWEGALINIVGTAIHHIIDSIISIIILKAALPLLKNINSRIRVR